jgi:hypothetical protein
MASITSARVMRGRPAQRREPLGLLERGHQQRRAGSIGLLAQPLGDREERFERHLARFLAAPRIAPWVPAARARRPERLVPRGRRHAGAVSVEAIEALEAVADERRLLLDRGGRDFRSLRGCVVTGCQRDGVEAAGDHEHRAALGRGPRRARPQRFFHVPRHLGLARERAVALQRGERRLAAHQHAVGGEPRHELRRGDVAMRALEQVVPQLVVVAAAAALGERMQVAAVAPAPLVEQGLERVLGRFERALRAVVEVDEAQLAAELRALAQRHQLGRVIAEGIVGGVPPLAFVRLFLRDPLDAIRIHRERRPGALVDDQRDQRVEAGRPLDEDRAGAQLADETLQVPCARRAVVAHREVDHLVADERAPERGGFTGVDVARELRLAQRSISLRAASIFCHAAFFCARGFTATSK